MERPRRLLVWMVVAQCVIYTGMSAGWDLGATWFLPDWHVYRPDFIVFWTAARNISAGVLYDPVALTRLQVWVAGDHMLRPFAYPPSALLLFWPLKLLPLWPAMILWCTASALAFWAAARQLVRGRVLALCFVAPPISLALTTGQVSPLLAAAVIAAVLNLDARPVLAGALLGLVAAVKPQAVLLAPLALVAGQHWRALAGAVITGGAAGAASLIFGIGLWVEWLAALPEFEQIIADQGFTGITVRGLGNVLGFPKPLVLALQILSGVGGVVLCWRAFRSADVHRRLLGLVAGSLLCTPYAMPYELAPLVPLLFLALFSGTWRDTVS
jgi:hypothetical protein